MRPSSSLSPYRPSHGGGLNPTYSPMQSTPGDVSPLLRICVSHSHAVSVYQFDCSISYHGDWLIGIYSHKISAYLLLY